MFKVVILVALFVLSAACGKHPVDKAVDDLRVTIAQLELELQNLITELQKNANADAAIAAQVTNLQVEVAELQSGLKVTSIIDFCGPVGTGYNEVGLRMSDGSTMAFFESGGSRFLTLLKPSSSYVTTDGTNCNFTTNSSGLVCDVIGCR